MHYLFLYFIGNVIKEVKACAKEFATVAKIVKEKNAKCVTERAKDERFQNGG